MSIGNLKDTGNQGNNFPWQLKVLQGLQCICDELKEININTDGIEQLLQDIIDELAAGIDVTVVNGPGAAAVNIQDGGNIITVDAKDLDIRDLDCTTDSVSICAGGTSLTSTTIGVTTALDVIITPTNTVLNLENLEVSGADGDLSAFFPNITSIAFFSNGTANALVSVNGGSTFVNVAPGTTINIDANSPLNAYVGTSFFWDTTTNLGSSLIIIYSYI